MRIELASHPCDVLGPEAIEAAGIGGREPERYEDRNDPFQRRSCGYISRDPFSVLLVSFNGLSLTQVDEDDGAELREATEVGGHQAMVHVMARAKSCLVSVEITPGVLEIMIGYDIDSIENSDQACELAQQIARDLAPYFPDRL